MHNELSRSRAAAAHSTGRFLFLMAFLLCAWVAPAQKKSALTAEQWRQDIDTVQQRLFLLHPNLFMIYPHPDFTQDITNLKAHLADKSDFQIALELQSIVAKAGDGQTYLDLTEMSMQEKVIPFALSAWSDGLHVSATVKRFEQINGAKVLKINGLDALAALDKMGRFVAKENEYTYQRDALGWFRFPVALRIAGVSKTDTLTLVVEKKDGKTATVQIFPLDPTKPGNRAALQPVVVQPLKPDLRWQSATGIFTRTWLATDSVLYVQYNRCVSRETLQSLGDTDGAAKLPSFKAFSDSLFNFLAKKPYAKVLIDLRFNPGGKPSDGINLAQRFAALPKAQHPAQIFVATNVFTQGAATEVAACFTSIAGATLIGETSGTKPNHCDAARQFLLPNSHIPVLCAIQYRPVQKSHAHVLTPQVVIPVTFEQYRNGRDPVLDFVRNK